MRLFLFTLIALVTATVAVNAQDLDPASVASGVAWVCTHQDWVTYAVIFLAAHFGFSLVSAAAKKYGLTADSPIVGLVVKLIRLAALDVKPPAAVVVAQAAAIQADPAKAVPAPAIPEVKG